MKLTVEHVMSLVPCMNKERIQFLLPEPDGVEINAEESTLQRLQALKPHDAAWLLCRLMNPETRRAWLLRGSQQALILPRDLSKSWWYEYVKHHQEQIQKDVPNIRSSDQIVEYLLYYTGKPEALSFRQEFIRHGLLLLVAQNKLNEGAY